MMTVASGLGRHDGQRQRFLGSVGEARYMALIKQFVELPHAEGRRHPTAVECGWRTVDADGQTFLLLETYGSRDRKIPG